MNKYKEGEYPIIFKSITKIMRIILFLLLCRSPFLQAAHNHAQAELIVYTPFEKVEKTDSERVTQQKKKVSGIITDQNGETIIGANIIEVGTSNGTITDNDGNFSLTVEEGATLRITYIGYVEQIIKIDGKTTFNIVLKEDAQALDEVVVVGYGTMRKKDLTGSVIQVRPDNIATENPKTVQDILRGTPGLQVGYDASAKGGGTLMLRGQNSVYAESNHNNPLLILDGMQFYGELSEINPDDIAQIDILKDASAAAIYGAKAASGVIIIMTKKVARVNQLSMLLQMSV